MLCIIGYGEPFYILFHDAPPQTGVIYQFIIDGKIGTVQLGHSLILFLEQGYILAALDIFLL